MVRKTFEELIGVTAYSHECASFIEVVRKEEVLNLMKQVRTATLKECAKKAFAESSHSNITSKDKSEGKLGLTCIHLGEVTVNKNSILNLDKESIEIDE